MVTLVLAAAILPPAVQANAVEVISLQRSVEPHQGIAIDYALKLQLPRAVHDALQRGVPLTFVAQASVTRPRWYWRDERITRTVRSWRVAYQPLTSNWRVTQGALTQPFATMDEALGSITRGTNWLVAEPQRVVVDERYIVGFVWQLDTTQLPPPMQINAPGVGAEWNLKVESAFGVIP
jgi:hypothetical protein